MTRRRPSDDPGPAAGVALDASSVGSARPVPAFGPYDEDDLGEEPDAGGRVDFGAVRVPLPASGTVSVEPAAGGTVQAVHVMLPQGRLSVSALAAPRSEGLWSDLAAEIHSSLRDGGARVRSFQGEWGRELHARTGDAASVFVGVDGPRWMLYGVATGPVDGATALDAELRRMLRGTVVARGRSPYPVRTVLPLVVPDGIPEAAPPLEPPAEHSAAVPPPPGSDDPTRPLPVAPLPVVGAAGVVPDGPPTEPIPLVPARRPHHASEPPTSPIPVVRPDRAGAERRRTAPAAPHTGAPHTGPGDAAPQPNRQPALAFLTGDPLELFVHPGSAGRHRRD